MQSKSMSVFSFLSFVRGLVLATLLSAVATLPALAQSPVSLAGWTEETYPTLPGAPLEGIADWQRLDAFTLRQNRNPQLPSLFYSDFTVMQDRVTLDLRVEAASGDNDWIGIALGFDPGATRRTDAEYLFIDWKQSGNQAGELGTEGLAISRAFGIPAVPDFAAHVDTALSPTGGVQELARGRTLGSTGWQEGRTYTFEIEQRPDRLLVWVDGVLEFDLDPATDARLPSAFAPGRIACYDFSQPRFVCGNVRIVPLDDGPVLSVPTDVPARTGDTVTVPLEVDSQGNDIGGYVATLDLDQSCLAFDARDGDGDGNADGLVFAPTIDPVHTLLDVDFDAARTEGELILSVLSTDRPSARLDGLLATIELTVTCTVPAGDSARSAPVRPVEATFVDVLGRTVPAGVLVDGSVLVLAGNPEPELVSLNGIPIERFPVIRPVVPQAPLYILRDGGFAIEQDENADPSVAYLDFAAASARIEVDIVVEDSRDDDAFGLALGYEPGDNANPAADWILIDWKQRTQAPNAAVPGFQGGRRGLAVSRVLGVPNIVEFFDHSSLDTAPHTPNSGVVELGRAATLGDTPWVVGQVYRFAIEVEPSRLRIFVDGVLEIDLAGSFDAGRFGFFNNSQPDVVYGNVTVAPLD